MPAGLYICEAVDASAVGGGCDRFVGEVELCVVAVALERETVVACDVARGKQVEAEEERANNRTLGFTLRG